MKIARVAGAFPPHYHQYAITEALRARWGEKLRRPELRLEGSPATSSAKGVTSGSSTMHAVVRN